MLSRVADSLYWMARYIERAEHTARLIAVKLESMVEQTPEDAGASWQRVVGALTGERVSAQQDAFIITRMLAFDRDNEDSMITSLGLAPVTMNSIWVHSPGRLFREALEEMHALEGVTYSTLSHGEGWYFLELGRHIERVQQLGRLLDLHFSAAQSENGPKYFDWLVLLKFCTAFEPYTKRYTASIR